MCVIVDTSVASLVFSPQPAPDFEPLRRWLEDPRKDGRLVFGGKLSRELEKLGAARRYLRTLHQAGRATFFPDEKLKREETELSASPIVRSNDPHILALARVSGARTLCTNDNDLREDFKDRRIIGKPPGSLYTHAKNDHLLKHTRSCGYKRR